MSKQLFAEVILCETGRNLDRRFTYSIPPDLQDKVVPGVRVLAPLRERRLVGWVTGRTATPPGMSTRPLEEVLDDVPLLTPDLWELAFWLKETYLCTLAQALDSMLPPGLKNRPLSRLRVRKNIAGDNGPPAPPPQLTSGQEEALQAIRRVAAQSRPRPALLFGVTGSGKTEVYMQAIAEFVRQKRQAIVLVPEISLTPQVVGRFQARFGNRVAVWHSRLSAGERVREWLKMRDGQVDMVVGARSAIFAPFANLGIIVVDEEHEPSYKQETDPKYLAREVAQHRAAMVGAILIQGSATPALESFHQANSRQMQLVTLPKRVADRPLPQVAVVDMREELQNGNRTIFSQLLQTRLTACMARGEQAILFINRRGFASCVICRDCGHVIQCPRCSIALTYHQSDGQLRCHYCGLTRAAPNSCPQCRSTRIRHFGSGTQRVEEEVRQRFPGVGVLRMDVDTTGHKGAHEEILSTFAREEAQVLVGTQMIAKGLDFPKVTLVGVVAADVLLNLPDFRAPERTFQLLTQVAGRAGRDVRPGEVVIQTYNPDHFSIQAAATHDYLSFYRQEIPRRRLLGYPPFAAIIRLLFSGSKEAQVRGGVEHFAAWLSHFLNPDQGQVLGPAPAPLALVNNRFRWHLLIKGVRAAPLRQAVERALEKYLGENHRGVKLSIQVDPLSFM